MPLTDWPCFLQYFLETRATHRNSKVPFQDPIADKNFTDWRISPHVGNSSKWGWGEGSHSRDCGPRGWSFGTMADVPRLRRNVVEKRAIYRHFKVPFSEP